MAAFSGKSVPAGAGSDRSTYAQARAGTDAGEASRPYRRWLSDRLKLARREKGQCCGQGLKIIDHVEHIETERRFEVRQRRVPLRPIGQDELTGLDGTGDGDTAAPRVL